ncbi:MAG: TonB C-terminal domain-containing protein [Rhodoferax sp.]|nr:TonB C-terminal domain-containing protein [Rhodoferax sp.]
MIGVINDPDKKARDDTPVSAQDTGTSPAAAVEPAIHVDSARLFADYSANEVSADLKYKGHRLAVSGVVQSINKDITDDTYLKLATENEFMGIHADLKKQYVSQAASLTKGQPITVICTGAGLMIGSPMLKDCAIAPPESSGAAIPAPTQPQGDATTPNANVAQPQAFGPPTAVADKAEMFETSFDCTKAKSTPELLICGDQELATLDTRLAQLFAQAKAAAPDKQAFTEGNRRAWNWREQNCTDKTCLVTWYTDRKQNLTNILNGSARLSAAQPSSSPSSSYGARVAAAVRSNVVFPDADLLSGNPAAEFDVRLAPDGVILGSPKLIKSSGLPAWDEAALRALQKTERLPRDIDGRVPPDLIIDLRPKL